MMVAKPSATRLSGIPTFLPLLINNPFGGGGACRLVEWIVWRWGERACVSDDFNVRVAIVISSFGITPIEKVWPAREHHHRGRQNLSHERTSNGAAVTARGQPPNQRSDARAILILHSGATGGSSPF